MLDLFFVRGLVEHLEQATPRMRLIRIGGAGVRGLSWTPGQHVRVHVKDPQAPVWAGLLRDVLRSYSVWSYDGERLELCVLDHGDGPGAQWAGALRLGDEVAFRKPEGRFVTVDSAAYHVFAGEETASVAIGAMLRGLPDEARVHGAVEVAGPQDRLPLPRGAELAWQYRGNASAAASESLVAAVRALELPDEPGAAYLAGEARTCQAIRDQLVKERGWPRRSVLVKPHWAPGRRGLE
ncbi:siderophore-interacting protein [Streptomyces sp. ISL-98]|uniref:siderophore-interacting protein n=1 Tax=Streptomyces sp. ISL-98 TaxID=2819192 RepID=UPI0020364883|nr:siderophore-interacting protein [Streptomyces sp. ISL-98]